MSQKHKSRTGVRDLEVTQRLCQSTELLAKPLKRALYLSTHVAVRTFKLSNPQRIRIGFEACINLRYQR